METNGAHGFNAQPGKLYIAVVKRINFSPDILINSHFVQDEYIQGPISVKRGD